MFSKAILESELESRTGVSHTADVMTPINARVRPDGLAGTAPGFSIIIERRSYRMRARVSIDSYGGWLRDSIVAAIENDPECLTRIDSELKEIDWKIEFQGDEDTFVLEAVDSEDFRDQESLIERSTRAAGVLSGFVLQRFNVVGLLEMRPSKDRLIADDPKESAVWEYDPSERDRATSRHKALENWLMEQLREQNIIPLDPVRGPEFDVAWELSDRLVVCEVKTTGLNETKQLRLGLGQVLHYRKQLESSQSKDVLAALMIEQEPGDAIWRELCEQLRVVLFWPTESALPLTITGE